VPGPLLLKRSTNALEKEVSEVAILGLSSYTGKDQGKRFAAKFLMERAGGKEKKGRPGGTQKEVGGNTVQVNSFTKQRGVQKRLRSPGRSSQSRPTPAKEDKSSSEWREARG